MGVALAYALCAVVVLAAAAITKGASDQPDRGLAATNATESGWEVTSFDATYQVDDHAVIHATERVDVDFHSLQKHGIFRNLFWRVDCQPPRIADETRLSDCPAGALRTYDIHITGVTDADGNPLPYTTPRVGDTQQVKIGNEYVLVSGKHTYVITYTVGGALDAYSGHDELYWNASGRWPVPVESFSARVQPPAGSVQQALCFQGSFGSLTPCDASTPSSAATYHSTNPLDALQQITLVATFPKGVAAVPSISLWHEPNFRDFYSADVVGVVGAVFVALLAAAGLFLVWSRDGRDRQYKTLYYLTQDPSEGTPAPLRRPAHRGRIHPARRPSPRPDGRHPR